MRIVNASIQLQDLCYLLYWWHQRCAYSPCIFNIGQGYEEYKQGLLAVQPQADVRDKIATAYVKLSADIDSTLDTKCREKFMQALTLFMHTVKTASVKP